jgi:hypothetical protein
MRGTHEPTGGTELRVRRVILWTMIGCALGCSSSAPTHSLPAEDGGASGDARGTGHDGSSAGDARTTTRDAGKAGHDAATPVVKDGDVAGEVGAPPPNVDSGSTMPPAAICTAPVTAADTSMPTTVVGTGSAASCTAAALTSALMAGGIVTFDCGSGPATITVTTTIELPTNKDTVIDGGGMVTIDGGGAVRILDWNSPNYRADMNTLTLQHITLAHAHAQGTMQYAPAPLPCSSGYYDGAGGALQMRDGILHVIDATFLNNEAEALGPDVGGGAIYINGSLGAVIVASTFVNNSASNAGAIGSLNSELDVYNSDFEGNAALGFGANSNDPTTCSVVAMTNQNQTGSGGNAGAIGMDGGSDGTHTFCGTTFKGNKGGAQAFGGAIGRTPDGAQQTTVLDRCLFDGNTGDGGGAAYFHNSTLTITASTFSGNIGQGIGTIQADGTTFDFTNVTFYGNHSSAGVGATLALFGGGGSLLNCTFLDNVCDAANMFAAAIFGSPNLTIQNTIFDDDTAQNPGAAMQCQVGTITGAGDMQWPKDHTNGGAVDALCAPGIYEGADPLLGTLGNNGGPVPTVLALMGSPALGRGTGCPPTDARGQPRSASSCTAGATEGTN